MDFIDLSMFLDDSGEEEDRREALGGEVYRNLLREGEGKYLNDGILSIRNGGKNFAYGAVVQLLLSIAPLKKFFTREEEVDGTFCKALALVYKRVFQKQIQHFEYEQISLKGFNSLFTE